MKILEKTEYVCVYVRIYRFTHSQIDIYLYTEKLLLCIYITLHMKKAIICGKQFLTGAVLSTTKVRNTSICPANR